MRVLALADKRPGVDPASLAERMKVDAVVCLGDLDRAWIESLMSLRGMPRLGVHGNHDPPGLLNEVEVEDLHLRRTSAGGLTFAGAVMLLARDTSTDFVNLVLGALRRRMRV